MVLPLDRSRGLLRKQNVANFALPRYPAELSGRERPGCRATGSRCLLRSQQPPGGKQLHLNAAEEAVAYVQQVGSPNLWILLDTYHMNIEEDSFRGAIRTAGKLLGHLHTGENHRKPPGLGPIPWQEIAAALKEILFHGWVVMEPSLCPAGR